MDPERDARLALIIDIDRQYWMLLLDAEKRKFDPEKQYYIEYNKRQEKELRASLEREIETDKQRWIQYVNQQEKGWRVRLKQELKEKDMEIQTLFHESQERAAMAAKLAGHLAGEIKTRDEYKALFEEYKTMYESLPSPGTDDIKQDLSKSNPQDLDLT